MKFNRHVAWAVFASVLALHLGCAAPRQCHLNEPLAASPPAEAPEAVQVGGAVYRPGALEIDADGLSLREAIHAAGGGRQPPQVQESTSNPAAVAGVQELILLSRAYGRLLAIEDVLADESPLASRVLLETAAQGEELEELVNQRLEQLADEQGDVKTQIDELIQSLSTTFKERDLRILFQYSQQVGVTEQEVELVRIPAFRFEVDTDNWPQETLEANLSNAIRTEARMLEQLYDTRGKTSLRTLQTETFIRLDRASVNPPTSLFLPYELVASGIAGEVALRNGDFISVVDVSETPLVSLQEGETTFSDVRVQGLVELPGVLEDVTTIGRVAAQAKLITNEVRGVWVLARPETSGRNLLLFVLPRQLVGPNGAASNAKALPGDVYTYTLLPAVPLIFDSQVDRVLEVEKQRCLARVHEKHEQHRQERHQHVDHFHERLRACLQQIPSL